MVLTSIDTALQAGLFALRSLPIPPTPIIYSVTSFEINSEREDAGQASMDQVMMHPLAFEIDDYAEYKRLHRLQRETIRYKGGSLQSELEFRKIEVGMNAPSTTMLSTAPSTAGGTSGGLEIRLGNRELSQEWIFEPQLQTHSNNRQYGQSSTLSPAYIYRKNSTHCHSPPIP